MPGNSLFIWNKSTLFLSILIALLLDWILADPESFPHPVVLVGKITAFLDRQLNRPLNSKQESLAAGTLLAVLLPVCLTWFLQGVLRALFSFSPYAYLLFRTILIWQLIALRGLAKEAEEVARKLREEGLFSARKQLSRIVGRDTSQLETSQIINAAVETVAENFADGVVAPLFYLLLFDLPGMFFYKAVNTLDSMIAYRNARYEYFGKAAAKIDDVLNYLPARIAAICLLLSCIPAGYSIKEAWRIFQRDRYKHLSPNSAQTEAVVAGALGLRLGGPNVYGDKLVEKEYIGDPKQIPEIRHIDEVVKMLYWGSFFSLFLFFAFYTIA